MNDRIYCPPFAPMTEFYKKEILGDSWRVKYIEMDEKVVQWEKIRGAIGGNSHFTRDLAAGKYVGLFREGAR